MKSAQMIVLICLLSLHVLPAFAVDMSFDGSVGMRIQYTPEFAWQIEKSLHMTSEYNFGSRIFGTVGFSGLGFENDWRPVFATNDNLDLTINRMTISTRAPFFATGSSFVTTFGDLDLNYSAYALRLDHTLRYGAEWINPRKRGVAVSQIELLTNRLNLLADTKILLDAALFWDTDYSQRYKNDLCIVEPTEQKITNDGIVEAAHLQATRAGMLLDFTYVNYKGLIEKKIADTVNSDTYEMFDKALVLELEKRLGNTLALELVTGRNQKRFQYLESRIGNQVTYRSGAQQELLSAGDLLLAELKKDFGIWRLTLGYQYMDPRFDPEYRDRTPRYDREGKKLAWNPIDRLAVRPGVVYGTYEQMYDPANFTARGKKGGYVSVDIKLGTMKLMGLLDNYQELTNEPGLANSYSVLTSKVETPFLWNSVLGFTNEQILNRQVAQDGRFNTAATSYAAVELTKPVYSWANSTLDVIGFYEYQDDYEEPISVINKACFISYSVMKGTWLGFKFTMGATHETLNTVESVVQTLMPQFRLSYRLQNGVSVLANWTNPNRADEKLYDRHGEEYVGKDNVFECKIILEF